MSARVKHFSSALLPALKEERHFALIDGVAFSNRRLARNRFQVRNSVRPSNYALCSNTEKRKRPRPHRSQGRLPLAALPQELLADTIDPALEVINGTGEVKGLAQVG